MNCAIICCGGSSARSGLKYNKIFFLLGKKTVLETTVEKFKDFDRIIVVAKKSDFSRIRALKFKDGLASKIVLAEGGTTRTASVFSGLIAANGSDFVAIHDGARPFVSQRLVEILLHAAQEKGNAIPFLPLSDAAISSVENTTSYIDKKTVKLLQTPQCFGYKQIFAAYQSITEGGRKDFADDSEVFFLAGNSLFFCEGEKNNIKLTYSEDFLPSSSFSLGSDLKLSNAACLRENFGFEKSNAFGGKAEFCENNKLQKDFCPNDNLKINNAMGLNSSVGFDNSMTVDCSKGVDNSTGFDNSIAVDCSDELNSSIGLDNSIGVDNSEKLNSSIGLDSSIGVDNSEKLDSSMGVESYLGLDNSFDSKHKNKQHNLFVGHDFFARNMEEPSLFVVGHGFDVHRLVPRRKLVLGGIEIPFTLGLLGHSDADVVLHALCDALLSAAASPDIGVIFPDTDPKYEGIDSTILLKRSLDVLAKKDLQPQSISIVVMAQKPKLAEFLPMMSQKIADIIGLEREKVNISATTTEGLGIVGKEEGIASSAIVLCLPRNKGNRE
jgi:2-C-methyl-D-erythritol 2,4-cyclodiphosphate synthase